MLSICFVEGTQHEHDCAAYIAETLRKSTFASTNHNFAAVDTVVAVKASGVIEEYLAANPKRRPEVRNNDNLSTGCIIS